MVLKWLEKKVFEESLTNTSVFRNIVRREAYRRAGGDPEAVHEMALEALNEYDDVIGEHSSDFDLPELHVSFGGRDTMPFGTAAGLDKNADAVRPLSRIFGFQEGGTYIIPQRKGNDQPRVAADEENSDLYNAQGFPSKGLSHSKANLGDYRAYGGDGIILGSICGIPPSPEELDSAYDDTGNLVTELGGIVNVFVWNPFSPNTAALTALRNPETFEEYAKLIKGLAPDCKALVKMGPYDDVPEKREDWLRLVRGWMNGGGDGIVAVNTYMVQKEQVPSPSWGYPSAGRSGRFLRPYRQRAIRDARREFPGAIIVATGGIDSAEQAFQAFEAGADLLEGYTPYTFHGFGLVREMALGVRDRIRAAGYDTLKEYQNARRRPRQSI